MDDLERGLFADIAAMPVIDTHEHLPFAESDRPKDVDVLREYLSHYLSADLVSAGLPPADLERVRNPGLPLAERWDLVEPFWEACRYTGYARALDIAVRGIYGIDGIRRSTLAALDAAFRAVARSRPFPPGAQGPLRHRGQPARRVHGPVRGGRRPVPADVAARVLPGAAARRGEGNPVG